jgi:ATP-dependent HslUV protease ATP-binding subunit HslU
VVRSTGRENGHVLFIAAALSIFPAGDLFPSCRPLPEKVDWRACRRRFEADSYEPQCADQAYPSLLATEGIAIEFGEDAIDELADIACG